MDTKADVSQEEVLLFPCASHDVGSERAMVPDTGARVEQMCEAIIRMLRPGTSSGPQDLFLGEQMLRTAMQRALLPRLEEGLRSLATHWRQELRRSLQDLEELERLVEAPLTEEIRPPWRTEAVLLETSDSVMSQHPPSHLESASAPRPCSLPVEKIPLEYSATIEPATDGVTAAGSFTRGMVEPVCDRLPAGAVLPEQVDQGTASEGVTAVADEQSVAPEDQPEEGISAQPLAAESVCQPGSEREDAKPPEFDAYLQRANTRMRRGELLEAIADYTQAITADPSSAIAYMNRALAHAKKEDWYSAIGDASEAIQRDPKLGGAYFIRAAAKHRLQGYDTAIADLDELLRLDPSHVLAYNERGLVYASKEQFHRAIADYAEALRLKPHFALARYNRAVALRLKGDHQLAIAEFSQMLDRMPHNSYLFHQRGLAHLGNGDTDKAIADFDAALELNPDFEAAGQNRRKALRQIREPKARTEGDKAVATKRDHVQLKCSACGALGLVRFDRLGQQFECRSCATVFRVHQDGQLVALAQPQTLGNRLKALSRWRPERRWATASLFLFVIIGGLSWCLSRPVGLAPLPLDLEDRAKLMGKAWVNRDLILMRRLTASAEGRSLRQWLNLHQSPTLSDGLNPSLFIRHAQLEVRVQDKRSDAVRLSIRITNPATAPLELHQHWVRQGDTWYFQPTTSMEIKAGKQSASHRRAI